jgi:hypothetical protein
MTTRYRATISTKLNVTVTLTANNEEEAADQAWLLAQEYARTVLGDSFVSAEADFDGIGVEGLEVL